MDIKELEMYTYNLKTYSAQDVKELEEMTDDELWEYQHEVEFGTGNLSDWDHIRAIITFRKKILELEYRLL